MIKNPILPGFHPDPSIIRVDDTYYIANSTFEWFPGVAIHQSKNLRDWELLPYPLDTASMLDLKGVPNGGGVWAPCLSFQDGIYYLVFSIVRTSEERMQDTANYITKAADIRGPWSPPVYLNSGGFDASLFHDQTDQTAWLLQMKWDFQPGHNLFRGIFMRQFDKAANKLVGESICIFKGTDRGFTEGPHLYQQAGRYYLLTAEGGTRDTHCSTMARSVRREGPYEADPAGPLLSAYEVPEWPIQYAGHADVFEAQTGEWFMVHLGVRRHLAGGFSVMGRETFLQAGYWTEDGWFRLKGGPLPQEYVERKEKAGMPVSAQELSASTQEARRLDFYRTYTFDTPNPDLHFSTLRIPFVQMDASLTERPGYLRLRGAESILSKHAQTMTGVRIANLSFEAETQIDFSPMNYQQMAGVTLFYNTANFYYCFISYEEGIGRHLQVMIRDAKQTRYLCKEPVRLQPDRPVRLHIRFTPVGLRFFYTQPAADSVDKGDAPPVAYTPIGDAEELLPITILSDEYATISGEQGFTGAFLGLCCQDLSGARIPADYAYLTIEPVE
ncbi:MAG: glycoside hydrolase family 43 protein [Lachnospiraceae bacterium]